MTDDDRQTNDDGRHRAKDASSIAAARQKLKLTAGNIGLVCYSSFINQPVGEKRCFTIMQEIADERYNMTDLTATNVWREIELF